MTELPPLDSAALPLGIRARFVDRVNGLRVHLLEGGGAPRRPLILLLHGFPEIAYSWRKIMLPLAEAGFRVVAPDLHGYGRTSGWSADYDGDLHPFGILNAVRDAGRERAAHVLVPNEIKRLDRGQAARRPPPVLAVDWIRQS
jgi:hypothetical protein